MILRKLDMSSFCKSSQHIGKTDHMMIDRSSRDFSCSFGNKRQPVASFPGIPFHPGQGSNSVAVI
jgi:hypothetical protein